jgi:hypothetical protein
LKLDLSGTLQDGIKAYKNLMRQGYRRKIYKRQSVKEYLKIE